MITPKDEYRKLIISWLEENWKSFKILFELKHYGNCISIMLQELEQVIRILYLLNQPDYIRDQLINNSINNQKWFIIDVNNKRRYIKEAEIFHFSDNLTGWEAGIIEFGSCFRNISNNYNYMSKDPIKSLNDSERNSIYKYIIEYHNKEFSNDYSITDLIPVLPMIFSKISDKIKEYIRILNN